MLLDDNENLQILFTYNLFAPGCNACFGEAAREGKLGYGEQDYDTIRFTFNAWDTRRDDANAQTWRPGSRSLYVCFVSTGVRVSAWFCMLRGVSPLFGSGLEAVMRIAAVCTA